MAVIEVDGLRKRYRDTVAVAGVSFSVEPGEIFGILGPNGAGKTTTAECTVGLGTPDAGAVRVMGPDPAATGRRSAGGSACSYRRPRFPAGRRSARRSASRPSATPRSASSPVASASASRSRSH
jgi:ABC-type cobalamin/Fe3+-siderophores transport system ATPase subunit